VVRLLRSATLKEIRLDKTHPFGPLSLPKRDIGFAQPCQCDRCKIITGCLGGDAYLDARLSKLGRSARPGSTASGAAGALAASEPWYVAGRPRRLGRANGLPATCARWGQHAVLPKFAVTSGPRAVTPSTSAVTARSAR
jgi:hypothetical protein